MGGKREIKNLKKAADRIKKAVADKEKIVLYGDADLDGISSVVILKECIQNLGGSVTQVFFPDRENDGYGITERALNRLKEFAPALFISMDLGIGNFEEVEIAKKMGFEVIIIDHHQILGKLPKAAVIVDPKQKGDNYPFKGFATAGLSFKLAEELLDLSPNLRTSFLELTALATLADQMPPEAENKQYIDEGTSSLRNTFRPGLKAFFNIIEDNVIARMVSALNTCDRTDKINENYLLLTSTDDKEALRIANKLIERSLQKQIRVKEIIQEVENKIKQKPEETIVFEGDPLWPLILAGSVASSISQKYQKPVFIYKKGEETSRGSVRVPKDVNSVDAMATCSNILITYGGHPPASGFTIKNENLEKFKACLIKYFEKR